MRESLLCVVPEAYLYRELPKNGKSSQESENLINPYDYRSLKKGDEEE